MPGIKENIQALKGMLKVVPLDKMADAMDEINLCNGTRNCGACAVQYTELHFDGGALPVNQDRQFDINRVASLWDTGAKMMRFPALIQAIKKDNKPCIICFWTKGDLGSAIGNTHIINAIPDDSADGVSFIDAQKGETYTIAKMQGQLMSRDNVLCVWTPDSYSPA
ncbi:MAG: hypothetical protein MI802_07765 [Desulfobacterales bacterium]|nr:hypothetical protein [Desulfobacterales bacterium]